MKGKRALVTGSTSGIGEQIAKTLAEEGVQVIVHGRRTAEAERVVGEISQAGGTAIAVTGELGSDAEAAKVVETALAAFGGVDILVNNAGAFPMKLWMQSTAAEWVDLYNANVGSVVRLVTQLVPAMVERRWGRVIMLGSFLGPMPQPIVASYSTTKAANIAQAVSLSKELGGTGVTANAVSPGPIRTPGMEAGVREMMTAQGQEYDFDVFEQFYVKETRLAANKIGSPVDIANAVAFLASPRADFITGTNLRVDGGMLPTTN
ncbi:SDR family NAD(P)-dependent oxidoreductase [Terriglobus sp.]|uniref:SDR family NAD(P)-dependent oxidoreductase n=1 Tax=Terriglobus sp. TaxID=1889013 RepID=UPI003B00506F